MRHSHKLFLPWVCMQLVNREPSLKLIAKSASYWPGLAEILRSVTLCYRLIQYLLRQ